MVHFAPNGLEAGPEWLAQPWRPSERTNPLQASWSLRVDLEQGTLGNTS